MRLPTIKNHVSGWREGELKKINNWDEGGERQVDDGFSLNKVDKIRK